jgi:hypothetical protein
MKKYKVVFLASSVVMSVVAHATSIAQPSILNAIQDSKQVECVGVKKVTEPKKTTIYKDYKIELSLNESGNYEAIELDSSDLGGYSPIPYPCKFIDGLTSTDLNITNEKVFICNDDNYAITEEVYLLKNCMVKVY